MAGETTDRAEDIVDTWTLIEPSRLSTRSLQTFSRYEAREKATDQRRVERQLVCKPD
jgi:hypothetical protein